MADTRDQILATAFRLFFEKGYKEVTMSQLVEATGLSKGAFYHYFSSKEELYKVTLEKYVSYLDNFTLDFEEHLTLRENLICLFSRFAYITTELKESLFRKEFGMSNYLLFLQEAMKKNDFREKIARYNSMFYKELADWIDKAKQKGEIDPELDSVILARHLTSLMKGMTVLYSFGQGMEPLAESFNQIIDQFFGYIELKNDIHGKNK